MSDKPRKKHNWNLIRDAYVFGEDKPSIRDLEKRFGCSHGAIQAQAAKGAWARAKTEHWARVGAITEQKAAESQASERAKLAKIALGGLSLISRKWQRLIQKINSTPPDQWELDEEIKRFSPSDFERLCKIWLALIGGPNMYGQAERFGQISYEEAEAMLSALAQLERRQQP